MDYTYDESSGKFSVISPTPLTISMAEGVDQTTTDSIFVGGREKPEGRPMAAPSPVLVTAPPASVRAVPLLSTAARKGWTTLTMKARANFR